MGNLLLRGVRVRGEYVTDATAPAGQSAVPRSPRLAEWRVGWPLVLAATAGMSLTSVGFYSSGVMLGAIHAETGWSRSAITAAQTIAAVLAAATSPLSGVLMDRFGPRRVAIPGTFLLCLGMMAYALIGHSLVQWYAMSVLLSIAVIGLKPNVWTGAVAAVFRESRALAFAIVISGVAISAIIVPSITNALLLRYGWRGAYVGLGLIWGAVVLPLCLLLPVTLRSGATSGPGDQSSQTDLPGVSVAQAVRSPVFARLAAMGLLLSLGFSALLFHFVPLLHDRGIDTTTGARLAGTIGLCQIVGRLVTGSLLDRISGALVGGIALILPVLPILLLLLIHSDNLWLMLALAVLVGLSAGSELDLLTYLATRHFGLRHYGTLFGLLMIALAIGAGLGPVTASAIRDHAGSYNPVLWAIIPTFLLSALAIGTTGPYPDLEAGEGEGVRT